MKKKLQGGRCGELWEGKKREEKDKLEMKENGNG